MDRITESLLAEFSEEQRLDSLPEDRRFEHFAAFITTHRHYADTFSTSDVMTAGPEDTGIDAIIILVNGQMITDVDALEEVSNTTSLDVAFVFTQADRGSNFDGTKIGNFGFGVVDFFTKPPKLARNLQVSDAAAISS